MSLCAWLPAPVRRSQYYELDSPGKWAGYLVGVMLLAFSFILAFRAFILSWARRALSRRARPAKRK